MDGIYGGWMLKDELFEAFDMPKGEIARQDENNAPVDAMVAKLILVEGVRVIERNVSTRIQNEKDGFDLLVNKIVKGNRLTGIDEE